MQSYEHVWALLANIANRGQNKEQSLNVLKQYASYINLTDSIRSELNPTPDGALKAYRPLSHYSDGAWMELPFGDKLKNFKGLEDVNYYIPDNAERKAADGPTDILSFFEHNQEFLKDRGSAFTLAHLLQDCVTDRIIQKDIATTYYSTGEKQNDEDIVNLYGYDTKGGLCKLNQTGKIVSMNDFRNVVTLFCSLTSANLWRHIKASYPDLTIDEVSESIKEAYERDYNENMAKTASQYTKPSQSIEKLMESDILEDSVEIAGFDIKSIDDIKTRLIELGAFNNKKEIEDKVEETVRNCIETFSDGRPVKKESNLEEIK